MPKKLKVFIGSSSEELDFARRAENILSARFDVTVWDDTIWDKAVFRLNQNFLTDLLRASLQFDYGLLIGTQDDKVIYRGEEVLTPRDNILFELGLFMGRLGISKCAFIIDQDIKLLSDFQGITLARFDKSDSLSFDKQIKRISEVFNANQHPDINFFPSSTLASVYFENFITPLCKYITEKRGFSVDGKHYDNCLVHVIIPEHINLDVNVQFDRLKRKFKTKQVAFEYAGRPRNVSVELREDRGNVEIIDFPTVISGINHAIQNLLPYDFNVMSKDYDSILSRELNRFAETLKRLLIKGGYDDYVSIKHEPEIK